jgi:hypothetical protein
MGLGVHAVEAVLREHAFKAIKGRVLLVGRQTVYYSPQEIVTMLSEFGIDTRGTNPENIELDKNTIDWKAGFSGRQLITDRALFRLLRAQDIQALDHSAYEGAEVIHDLRYPLPAHLHEIADFLVDGSTLDNVFTPSITLQNYSKLLRPGGRLIAINAFSAHDTPYVIMPPLWYLDYFVINGFADARIYVIVFHEHKDNIFYVDLDHLQQAKRGMGRFRSPYHMVTVVFAEKGQNSTSDRLPNQQDYRSEEEWGVYCRNLAEMQKSTRPHLVRSHAPIFFEDFVGGHKFVKPDFTTSE